MAGGYDLNTLGAGVIRWVGKKIQHRAVADGIEVHYPKLWRFCVVLAKDRSVAEDLAQATCERALSNADKFEAGTALDRWLFTLARRIWLNDLRAAKVRRGQGLVPIEDHDMPASQMTSEMNILVGEVLEQVANLPDGQRLAVHLVYIEGYSYREAATFLDIPIGTVMSRLSAARRALAGLNDANKD